MHRLRKSVRKRILIAGTCIAVQVLVLFVCQMAVRQLTERKYKMMLEEKDAVLETAGRTVYLTRREIRAGESFTEENIERRYLLSEQNPEALAVEVIGATACADLPEGVIINTALVCTREVSSTERKCVFNNIGNAGCFAAYTVVDVRLRYANGENYCVLKKKRLQETTEKQDACCLFLTEEEQLLMSAAQYDVEMYEGAELYLVGFTQERLQEDAISTYLPSVQVISQLREWNEEYQKSFDTWCDRRRSLERRLSEHRKQRLDGMW
ncbi:MAG: hypothetical protein PUC73_11905 [Lachnospiraceae bacterium]|nr:hypothetical protein [Lachnospiraceae bacterium]